MKDWTIQDCISFYCSIPYRSLLYLESMCISPDSEYVFDGILLTKSQAKIIAKYANDCVHRFGYISAWICTNEGVSLPDVAQQILNGKDPSPWYQKHAELTRLTMSLFEYLYEQKPHHTASIIADNKWEVDGYCASNCWQGAWSVYEFTSFFRGLVSLTEGARSTKEMARINVRNAAKAADEMIRGNAVGLPIHRQTKTNPLTNIRLQQLFIRTAQEDPVFDRKMFKPWSKLQTRVANIERKNKEFKAYKV